MTAAEASTATAAFSEPVVVETKLHPPALRSGLVPRPELLARLVAGRERKLTLVCAPAGWGKSTLLGAWCGSPDETRPFAWVLLDPADSDPVPFWLYVIGALRSVRPGLGTAPLAALRSAGRDVVDVVVAPLINELAALSAPLVLVLDDYHLVRGEGVHASLGFLLRHLPATLHVAIASRVDPPLPLGGLRAAGEVTEIRASDLRFDEEEADKLLNGSLDLGLDRADVELLRARTEGWAAGLQLAALSARTMVDRHAFAREFAGSDRLIGDYLRELLADQPPSRRDFLLRTSVLERLSAPLCDAVTDRGDSGEQLEAVERANLFLVALDRRGEWYRYHHLFRELLRHQLMRTAPGLASELRRRASAWHRAHGDVEEAIAHAAAAGEVTDARDARRVLAGCRDAGTLGELLSRTERTLQLTPSTPETTLAVDADLSERELTILRLLASDLSQREIGSELYISLNTVKGHARSIFRKLGVSSRAEAVARGREIGLL